jgi:transporter family-2 protein
MDRSVAIIVTALVGGLLAMQPVINSGLARSTSGIAAALVSFAVGSLILAGILVISGQAGSISGTFNVSWYYLLGGALGAIYVFWALTAVKTIGAGGLAAATITGQLTCALVLDKIGFLGLEEAGVGPSRLAGVALLLAGTYLIIR